MTTALRRIVHFFVRTALQSRPDWTIIGLELNPVCFREDGLSRAVGWVNDWFVPDLTGLETGPHG
jgi:hypothetical protein